MNLSNVRSDICNFIGTTYFELKSDASNYIDRNPARNNSELSLEHESEILLKSTQNNTSSALNLLDELPFNKNEACCDDELNVGHDFGKDNFENCYELILNEYIRATRPANTPVKHTMKVRLTTDSTLYCNPRRLSFLEKEEVSKVIDDLLIKGIIRPSSSPTLHRLF